ncbi:unnamed protein product [Urochloa humidicola]
MALGDPNTRPDEKTIFVPNSFDLERDAREWEECALVPWALHLPHGAGAKEIEDLLLDKLQLQCGDLTISIHQPEPFLIRFEHNAHCDEARRRGRFKGGGVEICLRRWRSLEHALGQRLFFRVRLYLDGIHEHARTPDIVEHVISTTCALQCINTDLVQQLDTRHVDLWAWTANPSSIPKKVWLVFKHRSSDRSTVRVVVVNERWQPERLQQGVRYKVYLHIRLVEDYTASADNLRGVVNNPGAFAPIRRPYVWHYGVEDGGTHLRHATLLASLCRPGNAIRAARMRRRTWARGGMARTRGGVAGATEEHHAARPVAPAMTWTLSGRSGGMATTTTTNTQAAEVKLAGEQEAATTPTRSVASAPGRHDVATPSSAEDADTATMTKTSVRGAGHCWAPYRPVAAPWSIHSLTRTSWEPCLRPASTRSSEPRRSS